MAVGYLGGQAVLVVAWWVGLSVSSDFRELFELDRSSMRPLDAFVVADAVVLAVGSLAGAVLAARSSRWAAPVVALVAGGSAYATLYLAAWVQQGGAGAFGLLPMTAATLATAFVAVRLHRPSP